MGGWVWSVGKGAGLAPPGGDSDAEKPDSVRGEEHGTPLTYGNERPYLKDLLICRPELAPELLEALRQAVV